MAKANCQRQLTACRNTKDGRAVGRKGYTETGSYPCTDVPDEKRFMRSEPLRIELWRILVKPQRLVGNAVHANDHGRRQIGGFKNHAPLRDHLAVTGKYNRLGRIWRDVNSDPPTRVVVERLANEFSRDSHSFELASLRSFAARLIGSPQYTGSAYVVSRTQQRTWQTLKRSSSMPRPRPTRRF